MLKKMKNQKVPDVANEKMTSILPKKTLMSLPSTKPELL